MTTFLQTAICAFVSKITKQSHDDLFDSDQLLYLVNILQDEETEIELDEIVELFSTLDPVFDDVEREVVVEFITNLRQEYKNQSYEPLEIPKAAEQASSLIQELAQAIKISPEKPSSTQRVKDPEMEKIKGNIVDKFFLKSVDPTKEDKPYVPPPLKFKPPQKERYRDNKIVSMKGERTIVEKEPESEEMKKTYINLKPARKYRFH